MTKLLSSKFFIPILQTIIASIFLAIVVYSFDKGSELIAQPSKVKQLEKRINVTDSICNARYLEQKDMKQKDSILLEKIDQIQLLQLNEIKENKKLFKAIINNTAELKNLKDFIE
jgi:hypothetical protein